MKTIVKDNLEFKYDEKYKEYEAIIYINNDKVYVTAKEYEDAEKNISLAVKYVQELDIDKLINLIVDEWYENDKEELSQLFERDISKEMYINNFYLTNISVSRHYVEYWFGDKQGLYGDHAIIIRKKHEGEFLEISLAG